MQKSGKAGLGSEKIIRRGSNGELEYQPDDLTVEEPLEIRVNGKTLAITMRTPGEDKELAAGFLLSEGIVRNVDDIIDISSPNETRNGANIVDVKLTAGRTVRTGAAKRFGTISSSCGICGKESIAAVRQNFSAIKARPDVRISVATLLDLPKFLRKRQEHFDRTGGIHAAAIFDRQGDLKIVREDIGRHNAVDKVIGRALLDRSLSLGEHVLLVSGRASFEIVQKALAARIPIIASVSAPSTLAVQFCRENNQTLIGFLRPPAFNLYSHVDRVILGSANE
jgi:FdhD protein